MGGRTSSWAAGGRVSLRAALALALATGATLPATAQAAHHFTVNTIAEGHDHSPGNGKCRTVYGDCSLRAAVEESNALSGKDFIKLPRGKYTLSLGELTVSGQLALAGAGTRTTVIRGGGEPVGTAVMRVLEIAYGATASVSDVTITGGRADGAQDFGGGVYNVGTLTLARSTIRDNVAGGPTNSGNHGGGIANGGKLSIIRSTISHNRVENPGDSGYSYGGGIETAGLLKIVNSTVAQNTAAAASGEANGGGIGVVDGSMTTIRNSTIARNTAASGGNIYVYWFAIPASASVRNSLIAAGNATIYPNCQGSPGDLNSSGFNLEDADSCHLTASGDRKNTKARLRPLGNYGGPTDTMALRPASKAIDHGSSNCPPPGSDQRGVHRPQHGRCDIGAFEAL